MILAIASQKGGTGKTTTAISMAAGLARQGKRTLLIDIDSQANTSKVLIPNYVSLRKEETIYQTIIAREPIPVHKTAVPNLKIAPAHILLAETDIELTVAKDHREARLKTALSHISDQYDEIIIDCPPALSWLTLNALTASDLVLVIISPGYFELDSTVQISKTVKEVQSYFNPNLRLRGFVFNLSDSTVNARTSLKLLRQAYGESVLETIIPRNTDLRDAHLNKQDIFTYRPDAKGAAAYKKLIKEVYHYEKKSG